MLAIPGLLLAIGIVTFLGRGVVQIAIAIAIVNVPIFARLLRGSLLGLREADYVVAARSVGVRGPTLLTRHMLPNAIGPLIVPGDPGAGHRGHRRRGARLPRPRSADPRTPEWGTMLSDTYRYLNQARLAGLLPGHR